MGWSDTKNQGNVREYYIAWRVVTLCLVILTLVVSNKNGDTLVSYIMFVYTDDVNMEGSFASSGDTDGDPVVWSARLKPFLSYRSRFSALSSVKEHSGSSTSLASITGCTS